MEGHLRRLGEGADEHEEGGDEAVVTALARGPRLERLKGRGVNVRYVRIDDADNSGSITGELARALDDVPGSVV